MSTDHRLRIYVTQPILPEGKAILERAAEVIVNSIGRPLTEEEMIIQASVLEADAYVGPFAEPNRIFSRRVIDASKNLKVIGWGGLSFEHIDLDAATERGIYVTYTDISCPSVADHAFALMLCVAKRLIAANEAVHQGRWEREGVFLNLNFIGRDVHHKTVGIVGLGRIGGGVARRAKGYDMRILYYDQVRRNDLEEELGAIAVSFEELLRGSDYIVCCLPLIPQTRRIFDKKAFETMKRTCTFINVSRGGCVDTAALYEALRSRQIEMAALDVIDPEPFPSDHPLLKLENVILVPHIAGVTQECRALSHVVLAEDTVSILKGFASPKLHNPEVLKVRPLPPREPAEV